MVSKNDLTQLNKVVYWFTRQLISDKYGLETWHATIYEFCVLAIDMQSIYAEYVLLKWLAPTQQIRVLTFQEQHMCGEYKLETWLLKSMKFVIWHLKYGLYVLNMVYKHALRQLKKFVFAPEIQPICAEYALEMWLKKLKKFVYRRPTSCHLCWLWSPNIIHSKWCNSCVGCRYAA